MVTELSVKEMAEKMAADEPFIILDVREPMEVDAVSITHDHVEHTPMSRLAREGTAALSEAAQDKDANIYVMCHHGNRSAQVANWLAQQGWNHIYNVTGGIDAYARQVDPSIGVY